MMDRPALSWMIAAMRVEKQTRAGIYLETKGAGVVTHILLPRHIAEPPIFSMIRFVVLFAFGLILFKNSASVAQAQQYSKKDAIWVDILRADPKLKIAMHFKFAKRTPWKEVLDEIKKSTGVSVTLARDVELADANFGSMTYYNVQAWVVMHQLAVSQVRNGRWEKSKEGYVMYGDPIPRGLYIDGPDAENDRLAEKEAGRAQLAERVKAGEDFKKMHPLSGDRKLWAELTVIEKEISFSDLLDRLANKTGLRLTLAEELVNHKPKLGQFNIKRAYAYHFMESLANTDLDEGRWVKTNDGYRLEGISRALRVSPSSPSPFPWGWTLTALAGAAVTASGGFALFRRRAKPAASAPNAG